MCVIIFLHLSWLTDGLKEDVILAQMLGGGIFCKKEKKKNSWICRGFIVVVVFFLFYMPSVFATQLARSVMFCYTSRGRADIFQVRPHLRGSLF